MNKQSLNLTNTAFKPVIKATKQSSGSFNSTEVNALSNGFAKSTRNDECLAEKSLCKTVGSSSKQNEFRGHSHTKHEATFVIKKSFELKKLCRSTKFGDAAPSDTREHTMTMPQYGLPETSKMPSAGMNIEKVDRYETTSDESGNKYDSDSKSGSSSGTCGQFQTSRGHTCIPKFRIERVKRSRPDKDVVCYSETQTRNEVILSNSVSAKVFKVTRVTKGENGYDENISNFPKKVFAIHRRGDDMASQKHETLIYVHPRKYFKIEKVKNKRAKKELFMMPYRKLSFLPNFNDMSIVDPFNADLFFQLCSKMASEALNEQSKKQSPGSIVSDFTSVPNLNEQCLSLMKKVAGSSHLDPELKVSLLSKTNLKAPTPIKH